MNGKLTMAVLGNKIDNNKEDINNLGKKVELFTEVIDTMKLTNKDRDNAIINLQKDFGILLKKIGLVERKLNLNNKLLIGTILCPIFLAILFSLAKYFKII